MAWHGMAISRFTHSTLAVRPPPRPACFVPLMMAPLPLTCTPRCMHARRVDAV